jgi:ABC-2 type transport system permease protein
MRGIFKLFRAHFIVGLIEVIRYPLNFLTMYLIIIVLLGGIFIGMDALSSPGADLGETKAAVFVGYMFWVFYLITIQSSAWEIARAAREGYIEREFIAPWSHTTTVLTKIISGNTAVLVHYFLIATILILLFRVPIEVDAPTILLVIFVVYFFLLGMGLIFAGLALAFKRVGNVISIIQMVIMGLSFAAVGDFGRVGNAILTWIPYSQGIRLLRAVLTKGEDFGYVLLPENILPLVVGSGVFFIIGLVCFRLLDRFAMQRGLIGQF